VGSIFNDSQAKVSGGKVLLLLVANLTKGTSLLVAFAHLQKLKDPLQQSVISKKDEIIEAQEGAEKNQQKKQKLKDNAAFHCTLIDSGNFWSQLAWVIADLEPICLGLNMNQTDLMCPDQAVLIFASILLHFQKHTDAGAAAAMSKHIEKR
jgi:hypothetical protein